MPLGIADDFTQLALHVLAHVPRPAPGDLYDPRHVARAAALHAPLAHTRLRDDAALIAAMPGLDVLDLLPLLHRSLAAYAPTAARPLADLAPHEVADPAVLRALQETPSGELVHITLALLADEFAANYAAHIVPWCRHAIAAIDPWLTALAEHAPGLAEHPIDLAWPLGPHGRALPDRLLIGSVDPVTDPITPSIVALHEYAVCTSGQVAYTHAEWHALVRAARWCARAPAPLRDAHARWLAGLDLRPLLAAAVAADLTTQGRAHALQTAPQARADLLRA